MRPDHPGAPRCAALEREGVPAPELSAAVVPVPSSKVQCPVCGGGAAAAAMDGRTRMAPTATTTERDAGRLGPDGPAACTRSSSVSLCPPTWPRHVSANNQVQFRIPMGVRAETPNIGAGVSFATLRATVVRRAA